MLHGHATAILLSSLGMWLFQHNLIRLLQAPHDGEALVC
jgi:hypothetical protein